MEQTTSEQLFAHLYEACNILRGPINQDEYKSYVIPILFFKRISDVYDEEMQIALAESGNDVEYAVLPDNHRFVIPDGCHWNDVREKTVNVGSAIVVYMCLDCLRYNTLSVLNKGSKVLAFANICNTI